MYRERLAKDAPNNQAPRVSPTRRRGGSQADERGGAERRALPQGDRLLPYCAEFPGGEELLKMVAYK